MPLECPHQPKCARAITRWVCGQRTSIEKAMLQKRITYHEGVQLLKAYGLPVPKESKVYDGDRAVGEQGTFLK